MNTRGVDHLAIVSDDMPTAMDFYTRVMGFRLVHARRVPYEAERWQPPYDNLRHYFFDMGNDSLFAIFEYPKGLPRQCATTSAACSTSPSTWRRRSSTPWSRTYAPAVCT